MYRESKPKIDFLSVNIIDQKIPTSRVNYGRSPKLWVEETNEERDIKEEACVGIREVANIYLLVHHDRPKISHDVCYYEAIMASEVRSNNALVFNTEIDRQIKACRRESSKSKIDIQRKKKEIQKSISNCFAIRILEFHRMVNGQTIKLVSR